MNASEEVLRLLTEIRDAQREHLATYKEVSQRIMETQERAVLLSRRAVRMQRLGMLVIFVVLLVLLGLGALAYLASSQPAPQPALNPRPAIFQPD